MVYFDHKFVSLALRTGDDPHLDNPWGKFLNQMFAQCVLMQVSLLGELPWARVPCAFHGKVHFYEVFTLDLRLGQSVRSSYPKVVASSPRWITYVVAMICLFEGEKNETGFIKLQPFNTCLVILSFK